jgi:hypothetical protein
MREKSMRIAEDVPFAENALKDLKSRNSFPK